MFKKHFVTYLIMFMLQCMTAGALLQRSTRHKPDLIYQTAQEEETPSRKIGRVLQDDYRGVRKKRTQSSYDYLQGRQNSSAYYNSDSNHWEIDSKSVVFLIFPCCILFILTITCWKRGCRILGCECCTQCCCRRQAEDDQNQQSLRRRKSVTSQIADYYKNNPQIDRTDFSGARGVRSTSNKEKNWARNIEALEASQTNLVQAKTKSHSRNLKQITFESTVQESIEEFNCVVDESIEAQGQKATTVENIVEIEPFDDDKESTMVIRPPVTNTNIVGIRR